MRNTRHDTSCKSPVRTAPQVAPGGGGKSAGTSWPPRDLNEMKALIVSGEMNLKGQLKIVARFVIENPAVAALEDAQHIAECAGVSHTTAWSLARKFGFRSYTDFRLIFQHYVRTRSFRLNGFSRSGGQGDSW